MSVYVCVYMCMCICIYVYTYTMTVCMCICICVCMCMCMCACVDLYLFHGVLHELIKVLVVLNCVLILEVTAKREHNIVSSEVASLEEYVFDECVDTFIHIVVKQIRIIL